MNRYNHTSYEPSTPAPPRRSPSPQGPPTVTVGHAIRSVALARLADDDSPFPALIIDEQTGILGYLADADSLVVPVVTSTDQHPSADASLEALRWLADTTIYTPERASVVALWRDFAAFLTRDLSAFVGVFTRGAREAAVKTSEPVRAMRGPGRSVALFDDGSRLSLALAWVGDADEVPPAGARVRWL